MPQLADIARFLDEQLEVERFGADQGGIYRAAEQPIHRIGLALEPWPGLPRWAARERLDAVFLHRPWKLRPADLPPDCGVLAYHLAFDEHLTLGFNPRLAEALELHAVEVLGRKEGRPIGMIGTVRPQPFGIFAQRLAGTFAGLERAYPGDEQVERVAVVGAMTDALVREAADRGAQVYVTGQFRQPARIAVEERGMGVLEVGHERSERWGLRALAGILRERWAELEVVT